MENTIVCRCELGASLLDWPVLSYGPPQYTIAREEGFADGLVASWAAWGLQPQETKYGPPEESRE